MMSEEADVPATQPAHDAAALFEKLKALAGNYEGDAMGQHARVNYTLTANGSALIETLDLHGGMVTVYTLDGDRVLATHYCAGRNQPRMAASGIGDDGKAHFKFIDITGLSDPNDPHMHDLDVTLPGDGTVRQDWTMFQEGKAAMEVTITLAKAK